VHYGKNGGNVSRDKPLDWTYYKGEDGQNAGNWSSDILRVAPCSAVPPNADKTPRCYIPALDVYVIIAWYNASKLIKWFERNETRYDFYQAEHPWGRWSFIDSHSDNFITRKGHMYGPSLCAKFQQQSGDPMSPFRSLLPAAPSKMSPRGCTSSGVFPFS